MLSCYFLNFLGCFKLQTECSKKFLGRLTSYGHCRKFLLENHSAHLVIVDYVVWNILPMMINYILKCVISVVADVCFPPNSLYFFVIYIVYLKDLFHYLINVCVVDHVACLNKAQTSSSEDSFLDKFCSRSCFEVWLSEFALDLLKFHIHVCVQNCCLRTKGGNKNPERCFSL